MKTENKSPSQGKKLLIGGILTFVALGSALTFFGMGTGGTMSQFSGTNVTPSTVSAMWLPSTDNPNRAAVGEYAPRLDAVLKSVFSRWTGLSADWFSTYLKNLSSGIRALRAKPEYAGDKMVQDVIGYLAYELDDTAKSLVSRNGLIDDIIAVMNNTGWLVVATDPDTVYQCPLYSMPNPQEGCVYTAWTKDEHGCDVPKLTCSNSEKTSDTGSTGTDIAAGTGTEMATGTGTDGFTCSVKTSSGQIALNSVYSNTVSFSGMISDPKIYYFDAGSSYLTGPMPNTNGRIDYYSGPTAASINRTYVVTDGGLAANSPVSAANGNNKHANVRCLTSPISYSIIAPAASNNATP